MKAWNPIFESSTRRQVEELRELKWYHSIRFPNGEIAAGLQSIQTLEHRLAQFDLPQDLHGARVLDIGAWDGWFSFEMERRGANVVSLDLAPVQNYQIAHAALGSRAQYRIGDITDLGPSEMGRFDIVLFFGVLYHLKHPLKALERVAAMADDIVCIETYVTENGPPFNPRATCEFYEGEELCGQFDNWSGPNITCLLAWCRSIGLCDVDLRSIIDFRAHVKATKRKRFRDSFSSITPTLNALHNAISMDQSYGVDSDDYIAAWFTFEGALVAPDLFAEIGGFTVPCINLHKLEGQGWHATFKLPFGLNKGPALARLVSDGFPPSNALEMLVGMDNQERKAHYHSSATSQQPTQVAIAVVTDGRNWERNKIYGAGRGSVSVWITGWVGELLKESVRIIVGATSLPSTYVSLPDDQGRIQINSDLTPSIVAGEYELLVEGPFGRSNSVVVSVAEVQK